MIQPCPKPAPREPRPKKFLPRSVKPIARSGRPRAKNVKRRVSEFRRCYHSKERVAFVKSLPCILAMGFDGLCELPIDNVHIVTGGVGRKADYRFIVPACRKVHRILHTIGRATFERRYSVNLDQLAAKTEAAWQSFSAPEAPQ